MSVIKYTEQKDAPATLAQLKTVVSQLKHETDEKTPVDLHFCGTKEGVAVYAIKLGWFVAIRQRPNLKRQKTEPVTKTSSSKPIVKLSHLLVYLTPKKGCEGFLFDRLPDDGFQNRILHLWAGYRFNTTQLVLPSLETFKYDGPELEDTRTLPAEQAVEAELSFSHVQKNAASIFSSDNELGYHVVFPFPNRPDLAFEYGVFTRMPNKST